MIKLNYDATTGEILGFYPDDIVYPIIPTPYIDIDADQHKDCMENNGKRRVELETLKIVKYVPVKTPEQITAELTAAVQSHLDSAARAAGYDDIKAACTYADEPAVPQFQAEGQAFRAWRSLVWAKCYEIMADVLARSRAVPTADELIGELPKLGAEV